MKRSEKLLAECTANILRCALCVALSLAAFAGSSVAMSHDLPMITVGAVMTALALMLAATCHATESVRLRRLAEYERYSEMRRETRPRI
jgi:hypothetical protein